MEQVHVIAGLRGEEGLVCSIITKSKSVWYTSHGMAATVHAAMPARAVPNSTDEK